LAGDSAYADRLATMREALKQWQNQIGDIGLIPEAEIVIQEQAAGSRYDILHRDARATEMLGRLVDMATKASDGPSALADLQAGLADADPSVRYWAATGIGNLGGAATAAKEAVMPLLEDSSPSVRIAAARAVAKLGQTAPALEVLRQELQSEHEWGRLAAAIVLDEMDQQAAPATADLKQALRDQPNKYITRVANRALNELLGTDHQVP